MTRRGQLAAALLVCAMLASVGARAQTHTLYRFSGGADGAEPRGTLIADAAGRLFGTTYRGGAAACGVGCGTVFMLTPPVGGGPAWTLSILHDFTGGPDGANPVGGVVMDASGALYGTTARGGNARCGSYGCGVVFRLLPPAAGQTQWTEQILYSFGGPDGAAPLAGVSLGPAGVLLGTTSQGGAADAGLVFSLAPPVPHDAPAWTFSVLYSFGGGADGADPEGPVLLDAAGGVVGTAVSGGAAQSGVVFRLTPPAVAGHRWTQSVLLNLPGGALGGYPRSALVADGAGTLYGTATNIAFALAPPAAGQKAWTETLLHVFSSQADGNIVFAGLTPTVSAAMVNLYGSSGYGGLSRAGVVYRLVAPTRTDPAWTESLAYRFTGGTDGGNPFGGLVQAGGMLYGTTTFGGQAGACDVGCGTVFSLAP